MTGFGVFGLGCYGLLSGIVSSVAVSACVLCWHWVCWCLVSGIWCFVLCGVVWLRVNLYQFNHNTATIQRQSNQNHNTLDRYPLKIYNAISEHKASCKTIRQSTQYNILQAQKNRLEANLDGLWRFYYLVGASRFLSLACYRFYRPANYQELSRMKLC